MHCFGDKGQTCEHVLYDSCLPFPSHFARPAPALTLLQPLHISPTPYPQVLPGMSLPPGTLSYSCSVNQVAALSFPTSSAQLSVWWKQGIILFGTPTPRDSNNHFVRSQSVFSYFRRSQGSLYFHVKQGYTLHNIFWRCAHRRDERSEFQGDIAVPETYYTASLSSVGTEEPTFGLLTEKYCTLLPIYAVGFFLACLLLKQAQCFAMLFLERFTDSIFQFSFSRILLKAWHASISAPGHERVSWLKQWA